VLSSSAEARDLLGKRIAYQFLPSLLKYVVIRQDKMEMRTYRRLDDGWELESGATGDIPHLSSLGFDVHVGTIYEDVFNGQEPDLVAIDGKETWLSDDYADRWRKAKLNTVNIRTHCGFTVCSRASVSAMRGRSSIQRLHLRLGIAGS
jgi:hypothetical protein